VRGYNNPPGAWGRTHDWSRHDISPDTGSWLTEKPATNEFRLWNATRVGWRINLAIGLSVAMTRAAIAGADTIGPADTRPIETVIAPFLDNRTWAGILRQRFHKGGIAA
jgi:hypothetical protein